MEGRTITVAQGVVQSTVSGAGNIEASSQLDLGFKTPGAITHIYVAHGAHVTAGQLLAELNPQSAKVTLEQARATLQSAEAKLIQEEETHGEGSTGAGSSGSGRATASAASVASPTAVASAVAPTTTPTRKHSPTNTTATTERSSTEATTTPTAGADSTGSTATATISPALREANIDSARATVKSDRLAVQSAAESLADTKLFAPKTGTIVSLSGVVGETVSGGGTSRASSGSGSAGESSSGASAASASAGGGTSGRGASESSSGSGSAGSSSASFAVLSDLSSMQLVVPLSESEVLDVRPSQPATVTVEALEGRKLAAHVVSVATLPTSSSGVVSYDVTFQLDQLESGLKPGMSATAEVVVKQAEGVNVPTTAISGGTVTVVQNGNQVRRRVVTGLAGNSSTIILSGLKAGEQIVLPVARATTSTASSLAGRLGSRPGGGLGGGATLGGGAAAFFGGGGGFRGG
jgi:macrolide-specific efflux system membrane fusion protein